MKKRTIAHNVTIIPDDVQVETAIKRSQAAVKEAVDSLNEIRELSELLNIARNEMTDLLGRALNQIPQPPQAMGRSR